MPGEPEREMECESTYREELEPENSLPGRLSGHTSGVREGGVKEEDGNVNNKRRWGAS